ncbi:MAG: hypothetical protein P8X74_22155 [Reinekea sp.]
MGAPAIFEKQIEIKLLHPASTEGVTDSGYNQLISHLTRTFHQRSKIGDKLSSASRG